MADRHRLPPPDEFRAAEAKVHPAAARQFGGASVCGAIPAFHGQNAEAVANGPRAADQRLSERPIVARLQSLIDRKIEIQFLQPLLKSLVCFEGGNARVRHGTFTAPGRRVGTKETLSDQCRFAATRVRL